MIINFYVEWVLWGLFSIYFYLDAWHTILLLETGLIYETNPVMCWSIQNFGVGSLFYIKWFWILFLALTLGLNQGRRRRNEGKHSKDNLG